MIHRHVFHNDTLLPIEKVRLSSGQAGLLCGWGLFTTVRISRGEAFAYERAMSGSPKPISSFIPRRSPNTASLYASAFAHTVATLPLRFLE